ncbi:hypothetical protein V6N11_018928 [Hibiscus sabdariffa]|uniref:Uncharacterized protein n=1 Tax=Hibiscus sabdariffa TaxID=183260 RepID=A0ABR2R1F6_9ROSI
MNALGFRLSTWGRWLLVIELGTGWLLQWLKAQPKWRFVDVGKVMKIGQLAINDKNEWCSWHRPWVLSC